MAANDVPCCEPMFWLYLVICIVLVAFAGLMSGLTLGLMSLSQVDLEILAKAGQPQDRKNAEKILPIVKNQHLLLCTLLIGNSLAMEALPIFLDALLPAWGAILISVTLILAFGEIIPQAVCSRFGLNVGAKLAVLVRILIIVIFPLSYPISKVLDYLLGKGHSALLRRAELKMFVDMHGNEAGKGGELTHDETTIITGALDLTQKTAKDAMTPLSKIFSLDISSKLDETTMELIISKGHSRVPIYSGSPENIIGIILVKNLMKCRAEDETPIRDVTIRKIPRVHDSLPLYDILNEFQKGNSHMAVVVKGKHNLKGTSGTTMPNPTRGVMNQQGAMRGCNQQLSPNGQLAVSMENWGPKVNNALELPRSPLKANLRKVKQGDRYVTCEEWELTPNTDEEVIGIITLEDVIEEILQEEILDETDGYVEVHNKISINMLPRRSPLSRSPAFPLPLHWRSPLASPVSPYHFSPASSRNRSPIIRSPVAHCCRSPTIGSSGEIYNTARSPNIMQSSPPLVVRYEKLHKSSGQ